jgi:hypothetical protein
MNFVSIQDAYPVNTNGTACTPVHNNEKSQQCDHMINHMQTCLHCKKQLKHIITSQMTSQPQDRQHYYYDTKKQSYLIYIRCILLILIFLLTIALMFNLLFHFSFAKKFQYYVNKEL